MKLSTYCYADAQYTDKIHGPSHPCYNMSK